MKKRIEFLLPERIKACAEQPESREAFQLRLDRPFPWLQRLAIAILDHLKAYHKPQKMVDMTVFTCAYDLDDLSIYDLYEIHSIFRAHELGKPKYLLIGEDIFHQIAKSLPPGFFVEPIYLGEIGYPSINLDRVTVIAIPWMRGILPLPDFKNL